MTIEATAYARAGLLGNPSDGYFGKTIAVTLRNFSAHVTLQETPDLKILSPPEEANEFGSLQELVDRIDMLGYYGGDRLVKAAIKKFTSYCRDNGIALHDKNFTLRYVSDIPRQIGLAGSSAIVTACMRALMGFYGVEIRQEILPGLILAAELEELGIVAGLMDRVAQVYEGYVYMDLNRGAMEKHGHGIYEPLDVKLFPPLYVAYKTELGKVSGHVLSGIRERFDRGDVEVLDTLDRIAGLARTGKEALTGGKPELLHDMINENFDLRSRIMQITESNWEMIRAARGIGASAKFAGSGGSIIGAYRDEEMYARLEAELGKLGARVIQPQIIA